MAGNQNERPGLATLFYITGLERFDLPIGVQKATVVWSNYCRKTRFPMEIKVL